MLGWVSWNLWLRPDADFRPVDQPIPLKPGQVHKDFNVHVRTDYKMEIEVDRKFPHHQLQCMIGLAPYGQDSSACDGIPVVLDYSWVLNCDGHSKSGSSDKNEGGDYGGTTMAVIFGWLDGVHSRECTLDLDMLRNATQLAVANLG